MSQPAADLLSMRAPAGALRILARRDDTEIFIVRDGERRPHVEAGERLALVEWLPSAEIAGAVARFCARRLWCEDKRCGPFPPGADGWHAFPVAHLKVLVANALTELHVTYDVPKAALPRVERRRWDSRRIARLGLLIGLGWSAKKIADDPLIGSTANNIYQQAARFDLAFRAAPRGRVALSLPVGTMAVYDRAARESGLTITAYLRRLLIASAADPANVAAID